VVGGLELQRCVPISRVQFCIGASDLARGEGGASAKKTDIHYSDGYSYSTLPRTIPSRCLACGESYYIVCNRR